MKKRRFNRIMALLFAGVLFLEQTGMEQVSAFAGSGEQEKATIAEAADMQKCVEAVRPFYEGADLAGVEATEFGTKNLIVATELEEFDLLGAEEKISLGEGSYALSYADVKSAKAACEAYQEMEGINFVEADLVVKAQTEEGNGKVDSMAKEPEAEKEESGTGKNPAADVDCKEQDTGKKDGEAEENVEIGRNSEDVETDIASGEQQETEREEVEYEENAREKKSEAAPEETAEDDRICVALLDTGIKTDIGNLASYIQDTGINISGSGDTGSTNDDNSHGTDMAQVIVSVLEENGKDSGSVKILPVKVLDDSGYGTTLTTYLGMKAAMEQGADIMCLGLSGKGESKLIESAVDEAHNAGITVIAAAGNDASDVSEYVPGSCEKAVVIASAKNREKAAEDSNYGDTVDFSAYGMKEVLNLAGETQTISGTSIACAYAAGVTASLEKEMSDEKRMFCEEVEAELLKRAVPVTEESLIPYLGKGIIGEVPEAEQTKEDNTQDKNVKKAEKATKAAGTINAVGTPAKGTAYIRYKAKYIGDTNANSGEWKNSGATCGTETKNTTKKMEALKFEYVQNGSGLSGGIYYRTHVTAYQWDSQTVINTGDTGNNFGGWTGTLATNATDSKSTWAKDGEWSGTTGKMKHLESYTLELTEL